MGFDWQCIDTYSITWLSSWPSLPLRALWKWQTLIQPEHSRNKRTMSSWIPLTFSPGSPAGPTGPGLPLSPWENNTSIEVSNKYNELSDKSALSISQIAHFMSFVSRQTRQAVKASIPLRKKRRVSSYFKKTELSVSEQRDSDINSSSPLLQSLLSHHGPHLHLRDPNQHR